MEGVTIFRQAMVGGFRKEDVIEYIENLEAEKENLKLALNDSKLKLDEAMEKIEEEKKIAQTASQDGDTAALKEDLRKARMSEVELKQQLRRLEAQNAELSKKADSSSKTDADYNSRFLKLQTDARAVIANQKKESEAVVEKLKEHVMELFQRTREKQEESEQNVAALTRRVRELEDALRSRDQKLQELEGQLEEQTEELKRCFSEVEELNAQLEERTARISELKSDISEKERMLENLSQELESKSTPPVPKKQPEPKKEAEQDSLKSREPFPEQNYSYEVSERKQSGRQVVSDSLEDALNDIFSDAESALSDSEKGAQSKLKFIHI